MTLEQTYRRGAGRVRRVFALLLAALLTAGLAFGSAPSAYAVTAEEIAALQDEAAELAAQKQALGDRIDALSDDISTNLEKKNLLDGQIAVIQEEMDNLDAEISAYQKQICKTEAELQDAQEREAAKKEVFRKRVRAMEEQGRMDFWSILLRSSSFTDLLTRLDFVNEIMAADQQIMLDLRALQAEIAQKKAELEEEKASLEDARARQAERREELDSQREAANLLIVELQQSRNQAESDMDDLSESEEAVQEEIIRLSRQFAEEEAERRRIAAEEAARIAAEEANRRMAAAAQYSYSELEAAYNVTEAAALGGYAWPVSSRKITSTFGSRSSPGGIGSTNHKGVDIGNVGYGTIVHAAKAGVVIVSQYHSSYGNYVVVSHGSGNTTLYAHMSLRLVDVGEWVEQGDSLGLTGSTGQSTGPHLHFEISENGYRVNPLYYLDGYYF